VVAQAQVRLRVSDMSTRAQVDAMIPVFLAALREAGHPVADSYAWAKEYSEGWRLAWRRGDVPDEVAHRAITLAQASIGQSAPCWWCWTHTTGPGPNPCASGDCRAPSEATR
jgi:hypothetical protein